MTATLAPVSIMRPPPRPTSGGIAGGFVVTDFALAAGVDPATVGDGIHWDDALWAACIAGVPDGATVYIPYPSAFYQFQHPIAQTDKTIHWVGFSWGCELRFPVEGQAGWLLRRTTARATPDDVSFENFSVSGAASLTGYTPDPASTSSQWDSTGLSRAFDIAGTVDLNSGHAYDDTYFDGLRLTRIRVRQWNAYGIFGQFVKNVRIEGCDLSRVVYGTCMFLSSDHGRVEDCDVHDIWTSVSGGAYGIQFTRSDVAGSTLANNPPSHDWIVDGNRVTNVWKWAALGAHSAETITFSNNHVLGCFLAVDIVSADIDKVNHPGEAGKAARNIKIIGNYCDSGRYDGSASQGITFAGWANTAYDWWGDPLTGEIVGNTLVGYGNDNVDALGGGIYARNTMGMTITGNTFVRCSGLGINLYYGNRGFMLSGNTFIDCWSNVNTVPGAIAARSDYNTGVIGSRVELRRRVTTLAADAHTGDTTIRVTDVGGWEVGETLMLLDGSAPYESASIAAINGPAGGSGFSLAAALTRDHAAGSVVSVGIYVMVRGVSNLGAGAPNNHMVLETKAVYSESLTASVGTYF